jgi:hypothetical protein
MRRFRQLTLIAGSRPYTCLGARVTRCVRSWRDFDTHTNHPMPPARTRFCTGLAPDGYASFAVGLVISLTTRGLAGCLASWRCPSVGAGGRGHAIRIPPARSLRQQAEHAPSEGNQHRGRHAYSRIQPTKAFSSRAVFGANHYDERAATRLWRDEQWR